MKEYSEDEVRDMIRRTYIFAFNDGQNDDESPSYMTIDKWIDEILLSPQKQRDSRKNVGYNFITWDEWITQ